MRIEGDFALEQLRHAFRKAAGAGGNAIESVDTAHEFLEAEQPVLPQG